MQVGPGGQRALAKFLQAGQRLGEVEGAGDIELIHGSAVVEQREELDLSRAHVDRGGLDIGFVLHALQFETVQVHPRNVAGLEAVAAHR